MSPPINIDGSKIQEATIDGQDVSRITIDGQTAVAFVPARFISRYEFEQDFTDSVGNNDGTKQGDPQFVTDSEVGSFALDFDGTDDFVETANFPFTADNDFSITLYAKTTKTFSGSPGQLFGYFDATGTEGETSLRAFDNKFEFILNNGSAGRIRLTTNTYSTNTYTHIAAVHRKGNNEDAIYRNAVKEDSSFTGSPVIDANLESYIAARNRNGSFAENFFQGKIDDLRVYDKALTATEVSNLFNTDRI